MVPRLVLSRTRVDLGEVAPQQTVSTVVGVRNVGGTTLEIRGVTTTCGCTATKVPRRMLAPGESTPLAISFVASSSLVSSARVMIQSNDPRNPLQVVDIVAEKPVSATVAPDTVFFHQSDCASPPTKRQVFVSMTKKDAITSGNEVTATSSCEFFEVDVTAQPDHLRYVVEITLLRGSPTGSYRSKIHVEDRNGLVDEDVEVEVRLPSAYFRCFPGIVVCPGGPDRENRGVEEFSVPHIAGKHVRVHSVTFGSTLGDVMRADVFASMDKTKTILRITRKQPNSRAAMAELVDGHLFLHVAEKKGRPKETFCIPVVYCNTDG